MRHPRILLISLATSTIPLLSCFSTSKYQEPPVEMQRKPLASWNEGTVKTKILDFVLEATDENSPHYVRPERRIATFDLDGTLIVERPDYVEVLVAVENLRQDLVDDPSLASQQPWKAVAQDDATYWRQNADSVLLAAAQGDRLSDYHRQVAHFLKTASHPQLQKPYASLFYQPMVELIEFLHAHDFLVYLVSASQQEYMRAFSTACLEVNPRQVVGSMIALDLNTDTPPGFTRENTWWQPMSDGEGKAERIHERIAASPILAVGNSGGDQEMLEMTSDSKASLGILVNHDDAQREFEYPKAEILEEAQQHGWVVVSMKEDWATVFGHQCSW